MSNTSGSSLKATAKAWVPGGKAENPNPKLKVQANEYTPIQSNVHVYYYFPYFNLLTYSFSCNLVWFLKWHHNMLTR